MESLCGYGSDDENDDLSHHKKQTSSQADVNYEEVQMELSEESNDSTKLESRRPSSDHFHSKSRDGHSDLKNKEFAEKDQYRKSSDDYKYKHEHGRYSPKYNETKREDRYREKDKDRSRNVDDKSKSRDEKPKDDRSREYKKDRHREDKSKFKNERVRESRKCREEQDKSRESRSSDLRESCRDERRPHRTSSRDRHRSRSPRRSDYRSKRSNSRDRGHSGYSKRYDRTSSKMDRLEKLGIELNTSNSGFASTSTHLFTDDKEQDKNRFYMPGITGRFTEQIQRRKLLWQKKEPQVGETSTATSCPTEAFTGAPQTTKMWQNTTFAQDTDGKVANKFKRLMGIKGNEPEPAKVGTDSSLKKQEEMFNSMEAQYEVARTATHTMRGVGLGFGSFQR